MCYLYNRDIRKSKILLQLQADWRGRINVVIAEDSSSSRRYRGGNSNSWYIRLPQMDMFCVPPHINPV
jgi:hypothetical protein